MRFRVVWVTSAQNELAHIWNTVADRQAVADASDAIDRFLRFSPLTVGEVYGDDRRLVHEPLDVVYRVSPADCLVTVLQVALVP